LCIGIDYNFNGVYNVTDPTMILSCATCMGINGTDANIIE